MSTIKILGLDLGKSTFHLIGLDHSGHEQLRHKFTRTKLLEFLANYESVTIAMEACSGAHWLARQCQTLGHQVKLIPPQYVKPYVKTNKNDYIDAAAIAEAGTRPNMRFVSVKNETAQIINSIHRIRSGYVKERTACMSRIGAILLEFGFSLPKGHSTMKQLFFWLGKQKHPLPEALMQELIEYHEYYQYLNQQIENQDNKIKQTVIENPHAQLLKTIPGVGDQTASQCLANIQSTDFKNGRHMAAWLGLVPHQHSTGGKSKLLGISKRGNKALRTLFIHGARAMLSKPDSAERAFGEWITKLKERKPYNVAVVALANKLARITWSVLDKQEAFKMA